MKQIITEISINATVDNVWSILTDFEKYPDWNPFIISLEGNIREGNRFVVTIKPLDSKPMSFKPKCLKLHKNHELRWVGHLIIPGLFDGEHIFELIELGKNRTKFVQREIFSGILVPFLWKQLDTKTRKGFELMNEKIKELTEKK